jgi:hypothetical protein
MVGSYLACKYWTWMEMAKNGNNTLAYYIYEVNYGHKVSFSNRPLTIIL